ncbi:MAG: ATP-binding cassette domain-containing protein, partial [Solirubrobacterales bacterium]|nr:ATP-binding cassette domain-containing protein [Solirubrobacterales bacterium]
MSFRTPAGLYAQDPRERRRGPLTTTLVPSDPQEVTVRGTTDEPAIIVSGLVKSFGEVRALDGVDLEVPRGAVLALLGPNGAGKTTAVRVLTTLLEPDAGTVRVVGLDVVRDAKALRERIGLAGQYA